MPLTYLFIVLRVSPNTITLFSLAVFIVGAVFFLQQSFVISGMLWVLSYVLDCTDGAVARATSTQSQFGAYFDVVIDRLISLVFLCLMLYHVGGQNYDTASALMIVFGAFGLTLNAVVSNLRVLYFPKLKGFGSRKGSLLFNPVFRVPYELIETGNMFVIVSIAFMFGFEHIAFLVYSLITLPLFIFNIRLARSTSD